MGACQGFRVACDPGFVAKGLAFREKGMSSPDLSEEDGYFKIIYADDQQADVISGCFCRGCANLS
jgi:hypothetical protein